MNIKNITEDVNWQTIPKAIKEEYSKNGHLREETHRRNDKGIMEVTYGGIMRPVFSHYKFEYVDFYVNLKFIEHLDELMDLGFVFDEELNVVSNKNIKPFLIEYSKGFNKGYFEFESTFKKDNPLFNNSNEQIVYKVYSRVINEKKGSFPMYSSFELSQSDLEKQIRKEKGLKILFKLKKESFFNSGFEGGEFYKAWEIILNNPTIFEPIFIKANLEKETIKTESEAITDLHHKYLQSFNNKYFKNVTTKRKEDGSNNSLFINHNFLLDIYNDRLTETISLKEHQDTLVVFNNRIGLLAGNIIKLYTKVNFYEDTKKPNYITQRDLLENDIKYSIKNIKDLYSDLIKEEVRIKNFETASDIQDFCISILNKTEYLLKDRFFISIEESPLNDSFKEINIELKNSIDLDKIKLLNEIKKEKNNLSIEKFDENSEVKKSNEINFKASLFFSIYSVNESNQNQSQNLSLDNWIDLKKTFFENRKSMYQKGITDAEVIKQELEILNNFIELNPDLKVLKNRYIDYLNSLTNINTNDNNKKNKKVEKYLGQPINDKASKFFDFLLEYYRPDQLTQKKFINILHYLKNDADKNHFIFKIKQTEFKELIKEKTGLNISQFQKSDKYEEEEKYIFHSLENTFLNNMKV